MDWYFIILLDFFIVRESLSHDLFLTVKYQSKFILNIWIMVIIKEKTTDVRVLSQDWSFLALTIFLFHDVLSTCFHPRRASLMVKKAPTLEVTLWTSYPFIMSERIEGFGWEDRDPTVIPRPKDSKWKTYRGNHYKNPMSGRSFRHSIKDEA